MDMIPQKGSRESRDLETFFEEGPHLSPQETYEKTRIPKIKEGIPDDVLREVIMPSEDGRPEIEWEEEQGISIPTKTKQFVKWPMDVEEPNFYLSFHARNWNRIEEFWGTIRKQNDKYVSWFELVKSAYLPWFSINVIPELTMPEKDYEYIARFAEDNIPESSKHVINPVPVDQMMVEYTFSVNRKAYTIVDLGMGFALSEFFYQRLCDLKAKQLLEILKSATQALRKEVLLDYDDFKPRTA